MTDQLFRILSSQSSWIVLRFHKSDSKRVYWWYWYTDNRITLFYYHELGMLKLEGKPLHFYFFLSFTNPNAKEVEYLVFFIYGINIKVVAKGLRETRIGWRATHNNGFASGIYNNLLARSSLTILGAGMWQQLLF